MRAVSLAAAVFVTILISVPSHPVSAGWPDLGRPICIDPSNQVHAVIAIDGADGAIIAWQDFRAPRVNIFARRVLASGELDAAWPVNGRALLADPLAMVGAAGGQVAPVIVADGTGGAIVAWQDLRSDVTEIDVFAQHVLASGVVDPAWPANGRALSAIEGQQNNLAIASDGAGGAFVIWTDSRPGASVLDIYAQHLLASGLVDARWPVNGLPVCTAPGRQDLPVIVADGAGGALIAWEDGRDGVPGFDIYAQHVLGSGVTDPAWPVNGRVVCAATGDQGRTTIASDGARGAIVAWADGRVVGTNHIFAQHVLASGTVDPGWPVNGRAISGAALIESLPLAVPDGAGGAVVAWQGFTVQLNIYAQHVAANGIVDPAWPAAGRALSRADRQQTHHQIVPDGAGGAIVVWEEDFDILAQHVLASGALDPTYPATGRQVVALPSQQGDATLVATGGSGAIVAWTDNRGGTGTDIFALQILAAGTVDVQDSPPPGIAFEPPSPNPAGSPLTLRYALPRAAEVRLSVYDLSGRRVRELVSGTQPAGAHAATWDLRDARGDAVGAGLYFARLDVEGRRFTQKLATLR